VKAAVVTSVYDAYDTVKPPMEQHGLDVEWVCVTDGSVAVPAGWRAVFEPSRGLSPMRAAKRAKLEPWRYTDAPASVWIDASYRVTSPYFVGEALGHAHEAGIAQFVHPWRDCLYAEADASMALPKYAGEPLAEQRVTYWADYHPEHWGLWAAGVIARWHTDKVRGMCAEWNDHIETWSFQDQVSQPYVLRKWGMRPASLPGDHINNSWLSYEGSARHG
jgi:hypothetical protein